MNQLRLNQAENKNNLVAGYFNASLNSTSSNNVYSNSSTPVIKKLFPFKHSLFAQRKNNVYISNHKDKSTNFTAKIQSDTEWERLNEIRLNLVEKKLSNQGLSKTEEFELEIIRKRTSTYLRKKYPLPMDKLLKLEKKLKKMK